MPLKPYTCHSLQVTEHSDDNGKSTYVSGYSQVPATKGRFIDLMKTENLEEQLRAGVNLKRVNCVINSDTVDGLANIADHVNTQVENLKNHEQEQ